MDEEKGFSTPLKILIVSILLVLVLITIFIYSRRIDKDLERIGKGELKRDISIKEKESSPVHNPVNQEKLVADYKTDLKSILSSFNGNYAKLQSEITDLLVPGGFQDLHLKLVLALNPAVYEQNFSLTLIKLEDIATNYDWLESVLKNIIENFKED